MAMWTPQRENSDDDGLSHSQSKVSANISREIFKLIIHWMCSPVLGATDGYIHVRLKLGSQEELIISAFETNDS